MTKEAVIKLAGTLADLDQAELEIVLSFAKAFRERSGSGPKVNQAKRKYTKKVKTAQEAADAALDAAVVPQKKKGRPKGTKNAPKPETASLGVI